VGGRRSPWRDARHVGSELGKALVFPEAIAELGVSRDPAGICLPRPDRPPASSTAETRARDLRRPRLLQGVHDRSLLPRFASIGTAHGPECCVTRNGSDVR
jgi:hypothetical protein